MQQPQVTNKYNEEETVKVLKAKNCLINNTGKTIVVQGKILKPKQIDLTRAHS